MAHIGLIILAALLWLVGGWAVVASSLKRRKLPVSLALKLSSEGEHLRHFIWREWAMFILVAGISLVLFWNAIAEDTAPVSANGCPVDTHVCSDGTYVSRTGPHCAFLPCPNQSGSLADLYNTKEPEPAPEAVPPAPATPDTEGNKALPTGIESDTPQSEPDFSREAEPAIDKNTPRQIDVETCIKGERAGYMEGAHAVTFVAMATKNNLCVVKAIKYTDDGGESYNCEFRMKGLPEQGFIKYFKVENYNAMRDKFCSKDYSDAINLFRQAAARGNANAQYNVAKYYDQRHGITEDFPEAAKWYRKAAEQGHVGAEYNLGLFYQQGLGVTQNFAEAAKWYRKAAEQGLAEAEYSLGYLYDKGLGVKQDYKEAAEWYNKGATQGNPDAQMAFADAYANGRGIQQSYEQAFFWAIIAAMSSNKDYAAKRDQFAHFVLPQKVLEIQHRAAKWAPSQTDATAALMPKIEAPQPAPPPAPRPAPAPAPAAAAAPSPPAPAPPPPAPAPAVAPVPPPPPPAPPPAPLPKDIAALEKLASEGDAAAQYAAALHYSSGNPLIDDMEKAAVWYLKAAEQGNAKAQYTIGLLYEQGRGIAQDDAKAATWYLKAAQQGIPAAQYRLGTLYHAGRGVKQDDAEAARWTSEAAELGIPEAQYQMGLFYMGGKGVDQSYSEAFDLFKRAAEQGDDNAQYSVATMLLQGNEDVPKDVDEAYFWLLVSAQSHNAVENLKRGFLRDKVAKVLPIEMAEAMRKRAKEWRPTREVTRRR